MLALLLALQAAPTAAPAPDVVVTGERLKQLHDRCRAGQCPPKRDAQVSIAWAESLFRDGAYVAAKTVMREAVARNKRHADTDPKPVAALYEAYATVAWAEGVQFVYRDAVARRVRTLRHALPASDVYVRAAALALGDMWMRLGQPLDAARGYGVAARDAMAAGQNDVALRALLAQARVRGYLGDRTGAAELLRRAEALPGVDGPAERAVVAATRVRVMLRDEDSGDVEAALAAFRRAALPGPVLVWAPPTPLEAVEAQRRGVMRAVNPGALELINAEAGRNMGVEAIRWADVGFWVRPDGRVAEAEVLRGSPDRGWTAPYLAWIGGRRYAAATNGLPEGSYRIERLTLRGNYGTPIGSLIRRRTGTPKLEVIDLTDPAARAVPSAPEAAS